MNQWHVHHSTVGFSTCSTIALIPGSTMAFTMKNVIILLWFTMKVNAALTLLTMLNLTSASATEIVQYTVWHSSMVWTWNQNLFVTVRSFNFGFSTCSTFVLITGSAMDFVMKNVIILISIMMEVIAALTLVTSMSFLQTSDFYWFDSTTRKSRHFSTILVLDQGSCGIRLSQYSPQNVEQNKS